MRTRSDLSQMQALPLNIKIRMTQERIRQWVHEYGVDGVFVSFSGGKDSTVLLDLVRKLYPDIPAVFVDVPTQYPELREFAKTFENVEIIRPKISFAKVCEKYGFPLFSKEISETIDSARKYLTRLEQNNTISQTDRQTGRQISGAYAVADILGVDRRTKQAKEQYARLKKGIIPNIDFETAPVRVQALWEKVVHKTGGVVTNEYSKMYDRSHYQYMLDAPFEVSNMCCKVMKKAPIHEYEKSTGRKAITGQMAEESRLRTSAWLQHGCNAFDAKYPISNPLSFWREQDVLQYIYEKKLPICSVYGEVVKVEEDQIKGQMTLSEFGLDVENETKYKTTGCHRTGCMLCGFGCHLEKPGEGRFELLKQTHPQMYGLLDTISNSGYTFREAVEWVNEHGNAKIRL